MATWAELATVAVVAAAARAELVTVDSDNYMLVPTDSNTRYVVGRKFGTYIDNPCKSRRNCKSAVGSADNIRSNLAGRDTAVHSIPVRSNTYLDCNNNLCTSWADMLDSTERSPHPSSIGSHRID